MRISHLYFLAMFLGLCLPVCGQRTPMNLPASPQGPSPDTSANMPSIPIAAARPHVDPIQLQNQARELLQLSQSLQPDIESVNRGLLPKQTILTLRRIEKLSKRLRSELMP